MWSGNVTHWSYCGVAEGLLKGCWTYITMHNWQHRQKQCNSCAPSKPWQLWKSKNRNMREPTTKSLSAGIQLWHIPTEIYADWSRLLQAVEMWSRGGQNVLWVKIKPDKHQEPNNKNKKKKTNRNTWFSSCGLGLTYFAKASEKWVLIDFQQSGGLLIWFRWLFRRVHWIPDVIDQYRLLEIWRKVSELKVSDGVSFGW